MNLLSRRTVVGVVLALVTASGVTLAVVESRESVPPCPSDEQIILGMNPGMTSRYLRKMLTEQAAEAGTTYEHEFAEALAEMKSGVGDDTKKWLAECKPR